MKSVLAVLVVCAVITKALSEGDGHGFRKYRQHVNECAEEYEISRKQVWKHEIPDEKKCFYRCMLQKTHLMNEDGEITKEEFKQKHEHMPQELMDMNMKCVDQSEETEVCDKAKEIAQCVRSHFEKKHEKAKKIFKECLEEYDIPKGDFRRHIPVPEDKICFYRCLSVKFGTMNEDGDFTIEEFKEKNPDAPKRMVKDIEECAGKSERDDPCETAKALSDCLKEKRKW